MIDFYLKQIIFIALLQLVELQTNYNSLAQIKMKDWTDVQYKNATGKTKKQLLDSGMYISTDIFKPIDESIGKMSRSMPAQSILSDVKFIAYTNTENPSVGRDIYINNAKSVQQSGWVVDRPVKILIHGLSQDAQFELFPIRLKTAYMKSKVSYNVITVDWGRLASGILNYFSNAAPNSFLVGELVGDLIVFLVKYKFSSSYEKFHVIGFSLGAQAAGVAGMHVKTKGGLIARITGLDPAGPSFDEKSPLDRRLDFTDALFVDIIHTNAGDLNPITGISFGTNVISGHVNFAPNGGKSQPSCGGNGFWGDLIGTCSHAKAAEYFTRTVTGEKYFGCPCQSWTNFIAGNCNCNKNTSELFGEFCDPRARGVQFLWVK